jgi:hypothetical protein
MNKKTIIRINESQLKNCIKKIIKEEVDTIKKTTSLKEEAKCPASKFCAPGLNKYTIDKWRSKMGDRKTAIKLIDYMIEKMVGVSSGDLADTATFANGIDGVEDALVNGDYKGALNIAGDTAKEMVDEEIGDRDFDEIPGFEGTRDALNALRIREEKKESFMKMRAGAKGKVFENDEEFMPDGTYTVSNAGGYEIMLSDSGDMAKVKDAFGSDTPEISDWLEIEYVPSEDGEMDDEGYPEMVPVIDPNGYNIPLNMVMRIREEKKESFMKMRAGAKGKVFENEGSEPEIISIDSVKNDTALVTIKTINGETEQIKFEVDNTHPTEFRDYYYAELVGEDKNGISYEIWADYEMMDHEIGGRIQDLTTSNDIYLSTKWNKKDDMDDMVSKYNDQESGKYTQNMDDVESGILPEEEDQKLNEAINRFKQIINY